MGGGRAGEAEHAEPLVDPSVQNPEKSSEGSVKALSAAQVRSGSPLPTAEDGETDADTIDSELSTGERQETKKGQKSLEGKEKPSKDEKRSLKLAKAEEKAKQKEGRLATKNLHQLEKEKERLEKKVFALQKKVNIKMRLLEVVHTSLEAAKTGSKVSFSNPERLQ